MTVRARAGAVICTTVVLLVLGACSSTAKTLDGPATERAVGRAVAAKVEPAVAATTCPAELPRGKGEEFTCKVELGGKAGTMRVRVSQLDDQGKLSVEPLDAVVSGEATAATLKAKLRTQFKRSFQVTCGTGWKVRSPGDTFPCRARDKTSRRSVDVTVEDAAGTLSFQVLRPGN